MKRILIAPEPAAWVSSLLTADTLLIAPWALPDSPVFQLLPSAAQQFWLRRRAPAQDVRALPGWAFVDAAIRRLGSRVSLAWRLRQRALIDEWVSRFAPRDCEEVVAPTLCALKTFARAGKARRVLVEDLPGLRQLHGDLDHAASAVPDADFLQNFRAPDRYVVRQEQERVLASRRVVFSRLARKRARSTGVADVQCARREDLSRPQLARTAVGSRGGTEILLAGTTAARFGLELALEALEQLPGVTLLARRGEGTHAPSLRHPQLKLVQRSPLKVAAVVGPAWVECALGEVEAAREAGIPVVCSDRAAGWNDPAAEFRIIAPGDGESLVRELRAVLLSSGMDATAEATRPAHDAPRSLAH